MSKHKAARRYCDQMMCTHCGLSWDVDDPNPPSCNKPPSHTTTNRTPSVPLKNKRITSQDWANLRHAFESDDWSKFPNNKNR